MQCLAYVVLCADGRRITLDRAIAVQYAADHGGTVHDLVLAGDAEAQLDWLQRHLQVFVNALLGEGGVEDDLLCVGCMPEQGAAVDLRAFIDRLRAA